MHAQKEKIRIRSMAALPARLPVLSPPPPSPPPTDAATPHLPPPPPRRAPPPPRRISPETNSRPTRHSPPSDAASTTGPYERVSGRSPARSARRSTASADRQPPPSPRLASRTCHIWEGGPCSREGEECLGAGTILTRVTGRFPNMAGAGTSVEARKSHSAEVWNTQTPFNPCLLPPATHSAASHRISRFRGCFRAI